MKVAIIGAGAAGCFCAANLKRLCPAADVEVFEAGARALAKVAVTGGGRCNLTNTFEGVDDLSAVYPRGGNLMKRMLGAFDSGAVMDWFEGAGVRLCVEDGGRVFPASQDAGQIVEVLLRAMRESGVRLNTGQRVLRVESASAAPSEQPSEQAPPGYNLTFASRDGQSRCRRFDRVVVTTGGSPRLSGLDFLSPLGLQIVEPVPSLFTFGIKPSVSSLMGASVRDVSLRLAGTRFKSSGALLVTHWGFSGPAVLRLSSYAARHLAESGYRGTLLVGWLGEDASEQSAAQTLRDLVSANPNKMLSSVHPEAIPSRIWQHLAVRCGIPPERRLAELGKKQLNALVAALVADSYDICGQSRFKEEFVTCGGVSLNEVSLRSLEARRHPGLYLAGEVLDVDAVTGGFNLQAAWSMGWVIAREISASAGRYALPGAASPPDSANS